MAVDEVREGMTGYGLSVFKGVAIERFEVKVLSVLRSPFVPKNDVVLITCSGMGLENSGIAQGMSGSPVFLKDSAGRERMIGAVAFGWPMTKDPIAGVQPIEYMLKIADGPAAVSRASSDAAKSDAAGAGSTPLPKKRIRWSLDDAKLSLGLLASAKTPRGIGPTASNAADNRAIRLTPLASPMATSGIPRNILRAYSPLFESWGIVPLESAVSGKAAGADADSIRFAPGSVMAVPMLTGDIESCVFGTCTEVLGERVFGFGHPFSNEGPVEFPLATGSISAVIPNVQTSFKIGALGKIRGTVTADQQVGAGGRIGASPPMIPMEIAVAYQDGSVGQTYKINLISNPKMTAAAASMALQAALTGIKDLPQFHTIDYSLNLEFANGQKLAISNTMVNVHGMEMLTEVGLPIATAADNPFQRVMLTKLTGKISVAGEARDARILSVNLAKSRFQPGETAKLFVTYRPFRGEEAVIPIEFEIPRDLADGAYQLYVTDWDTYLEQEKLARPFRFTAETVDEIFAVLKDVTAVRHDALYVRLMRQPDGVAIGRTAMPLLPSSRRQVLLGAGLSNTTPFVSSTVKVVPAPAVMDGAAAFALVISRNSKSESPFPAKLPHHDIKPPPAAVPTPDTKPKSGGAKPDAKPDSPGGADK